MHFYRLYKVPLFGCKGLQILISREHDAAPLIAISAKKNR